MATTPSTKEKGLIAATAFAFVVVDSKKGLGSLKI
jgi:hypothetical protein